MRRREYYWCLNDSVENNSLQDLRTDQVEAIFAALPKADLPHWWVWREGFTDWKPMADFPQLLVSLRKVEVQATIAPPAPTAAAKPSEKPIEVMNESRSAAPASTAKATKPARAKSAKIDDVRDEIEPFETTSSRIHREQGTGQAKRGKEKISEFEIEAEAEEDGLSLSIERTRLSDERGNHRFDLQIEVRVIVGEKVYKNSTVNISLRGMQVSLPLPKGLPRYFNVEIRDKTRYIPLVCTEIKGPPGAPSNRLKIEVNERSSELLSLLLRS